jgi:hypothetical protein
VADFRQLLGRRVAGDVDTSISREGDGRQRSRQVSASDFGIDQPIDLTLTQAEMCL